MNRNLFDRLFTITKATEDIYECPILFEFPSHKGGMFVNTSEDALDIEFTFPLKGCGIVCNEEELLDFLEENSISMEELEKEMNVENDTKLLIRCLELDAEHASSAVDRAEIYAEIEKIKNTKSDFELQ